MSSSAVISRLPTMRLSRLSGASLAVMLACGSVLAPGSSPAQSLFTASDVEQSRFVLVAAPIGSSSNRFQLNIYEQINDRRPCFAVASQVPAPVDPLLASFDFTGICSRYIDANGYSLRIGDTDLATSYRLTVRSDETGTSLVATPTKEAGPELLVARSGGPISGFHKLQPEPGWRLMRRVFGGRRLGHLYVYIDAWPGAVAPGTAAAAPTTAPAAVKPLVAAPAAAAPLPAAAAPLAPVAPVAPAAAGSPAAALAGPADSAAPTQSGRLTTTGAPAGSGSPIRAGDSAPLPAPPKL